MRLAKRDSRLAAPGSGSQARKIASPKKDDEAVPSKIMESCVSEIVARHVTQNKLVTDISTIELEYFNLLL